MLIRHDDESKRTVVDKNWGREEWIVNGPLYCLKVFNVLSGEWTSKGLYHYHKLKDETFYVLSGQLRLEVVYDGAVNEFILGSGDSYRIAPMVGHRFTAESEICKCIEVSTQHFDSDSYRAELSDLPK